MTKFIKTDTGCYVNINNISSIYTSDENDIVITTCHEKAEIIFKPDMPSYEEAEFWLQNFMLMHGLCIEPVTPNRCF